MRLHLLGVRGSTPAPGADFVRYGGHTSCVAVQADGEDDPTLVLDAGTVLRSLTVVLEGRPYRGAVADAYGHATVDDAVAVAEQAGVGLLVLLHHAPARTDDALDELARTVRARVPVCVAREGLVLEVAGAGSTGPPRRPGAGPPSG